MRTARRSIAEIEAGYAKLIGAGRFETAAQSLDALLRALDGRAGLSPEKLPSPRGP